MIKPMTDEESKRAIERAKANSLDEYGNYGENNGPLPETKEEPTVEVDDSGNKFWYLNGELHREDGPAIEWASGTKEWYLNGKKVTEEEHKEQTSNKAPCEGKIVEVDGIKYELKEV